MANTALAASVQTLSRLAARFEVRSGTPGLWTLTRGGITEILGEASSGRTAMAQWMLANATRGGEVVAVVDCDDAFDPGFGAQSRCGSGKTALGAMRPSSGNRAQSHGSHFAQRRIRAGRSRSGRYALRRAAEDSWFLLVSFSARGGAYAFRSAYCGAAAGCAIMFHPPARVPAAAALVARTAAVSNHRTAGTPGGIAETDERRPAALSKHVGYEGKLCSPASPEIRRALPNWPASSRRWSKIRTAIP